MIKFKSLFPVLLFLLAAACSMPATRVYTVFMPLENLPAAQPDSASLTVSVDAEDHLLQPYIVHRRSPYSFRLLKEAKWEASPRKLVKEGLRNAFFLTGTFNDVRTGGIIRKGHYFLKANLKRFERVEEDGALYAIAGMDIKLWSPEEEEIYFTSVDAKEKLSGDELSELAEQLSTLLGNAVDEIRSDVIRIVGEQSRLKEK